MMFASSLQRVAAVTPIRSNPSAGLADVLSGNPCTSSVFEDFRKFLVDVEHSSENLEFHLWFSNFEKRYFTIMKCGPPGFIPLKPPPVVNLLSLKSNAREGYDLFLEVPVHLHKLLSSESRNFKSLLSFKKKPKLDFTCPSDLPFFEEISIAVRLFFDPSSSLELNIPGKMREKALTQLRVTTHPDILRPVFNHIDQLLVASWNSFVIKYPHLGVQTTYR